MTYEDCAEAATKAINETRIFFEPPDPEREARTKALAVLEAVGLSFLLTEVEALRTSLSVETEIAEGRTKELREHPREIQQRDERIGEARRIFDEGIADFHNCHDPDGISRIPSDELRAFVVRVRSTLQHTPPEQ